jgi:hypothetical protein
VTKNSEKLMNAKPSVVVHACNPSTWEAEAGGFEASFDYIAKLCPKQINKQTKK